MGCGSSSNTAVYPLTEANGNQDETGSKPSSRGESAVSKVTTDSGVVMENRDIPVVPPLVPNQLPPLTSESDEKSEVDTVTREAAAPSLLQEDDSVHERPKSSEILEELLSQGIIPMGETREKGGGAAYSIMLGESEDVTRRPPARLESLKAQKAQNLHSREQMDERMKLVEERRKLVEDERKARLRSAHIRRRVTISPIREDEDAFFSTVELLQPPLTHGPTSASLLCSQIPREAADGGEWVREAAADGREEERSVGSKGGLEEEGENNRGTGYIKEEEEEEETHVEELKAGELLTASGDLENDSSFQHAEEGEEVF